MKGFFMANKRHPMLVRLWRDPVWRAVLFQVLLILAVVAMVAWVVNNTLSNLEHRGISTGFDFYPSLQVLALSRRWWSTTKAIPLAEPFW